MKVALINPASSTEWNLNAKSSAPPLGLLYLASSIRKQGDELILIDQPADKLSDDELISKVASYEPDVIGFSVMASQCARAAKQAKNLKDKLPNSKIVFGGAHATAVPDYMLKNYPQVDYVIKGEGELTFTGLIKHLKDSRFYKKLNGLYYRVKGFIKNGGPAKLITDLDSLPLPARDLIDRRKYGTLSGLVLDDFGTLLSSRGCPYSCKYCACSAISNRTWRVRRIKRVVDELELMIGQGYHNVLFFDDSLTLNNKRVNELCSEIKNRRLKINWFFEGRVNNADYETMHSMARTGCRIAYFGVESANKRVLHFYNKQINPQQAVVAVNKARKAGIDFIVGSFILGAPGETVKEMDNTISFAKKLDIDFPQITTLMAYPGTALWNELVSKGFINPVKHWESGVTVAEVYPDMSKQLVEQKVSDGYRQFLMRKLWGVKQVGRLIKSKFRLNFLMHNIAYFVRNKNLVKSLINR